MAVQELDTYTSRRDHEKLVFNGYHTRDVPPPDPLITETGPGTPMGEYFRRFWIPVCLSEELTDLPKAVRILSEDLVAFRDKSGRVGVLHRHCSHRGTSLEYGIVSERGIRCCYHGWLFDVDGAVLENPGRAAGLEAQGQPLSRRLSGLRDARAGACLHGTAGAEAAQAAPRLLRDARRRVRGRSRFPMRTTG